MAQGHCLSLHRFSRFSFCGGGGWGWKLYNFAIRFEVVILTEASTNQVVIEELDILIINILDDRDSQGIEGGQSHLQLWPP